MLGIILLNYNEWNLCIECIQSIRTSFKQMYKIYLVDNNSPQKYDEAFKTFIEKSSDVVFIQSNINKGYAGGNNIGLKKAIEDECDNFLISNNDVIFRPGSLETMLDYLSSNERVGIVGPKVYTPDGRIQEINMGCKMTLSGKYLYILRKTPFRVLSRSFVRKFHCESERLDMPFKVYAVSGCCFMIKGSIINGIYPLDEGTFLYEEENIIGIKMEQLQMDTVYCSTAEILHLGGGSTQKVSEFSYKCGVNSEIYYCKKYLGVSILQILPLYCIRMIVYIKNFGIKMLPSFFKGTSLKSNVSMKKNFDKGLIK